jgi:hypothetical protein
MARLKPHLQTPATWISLLALFVALGGTAYAAVKITGKEVVNNSLTGADIKNGSISAADLSAAAKKTLTGKAGATGANGAPGATGATGAPGQNGAPGSNGTNGSAVAYGGVSSDGSTCAVDTLRDFNLETPCARPGVGVYTVNVVSSINLDSRVGTCTIRNSQSGFSSGYCTLRFSGTAVELRTYNTSGDPTDFGTGAWFAIY